MIYEEFLYFHVEQQLFWIRFTCIQAKKHKHMHKTLKSDIPGFLGTVQISM